ncbi:MAG: hypothetical protein ACK559_20110, partial [bacterium]
IRPHELVVGPGRCHQSHASQSKGQQGRPARWYLQPEHQPRRQQHHRWQKGGRERHQEVPEPPIAVSHGPPCLLEPATGKSPPGLPPGSPPPEESGR